MNSCIYQGQVRHRRFKPGKHEFSYRLFMMYLDLDELPRLFKPFWLWSNGRFNLASFRREDHLGNTSDSLPDSVRDSVFQQTGMRPAGPIYLLTHLRYFGYGFNPVSFYYCFDASGEKLETIVCEVNNTPWGEQHLYVLPARDQQQAGSRVLRFQRDKEFHVSPFMPMDILYDWRFSVPAQVLNLHMQNIEQDEKLFDATLTLKKRPINSISLAAVLITYPFITVKVVAAIYFEALRLWLKKIPFFTHPENINPPKQEGKI